MKWSATGGQTNGPMDRPTNGPMEGVIYHLNEKQYTHLNRREDEEEEKEGEAKEKKRNQRENIKWYAKEKRRKSIKGQPDGTQQELKAFPRYESQRKQRKIGEGLVEGNKMVAKTGKIWR